MGTARLLWLCCLPATRCDGARAPECREPRGVSDAAEPVAAGVIRVGRAGRPSRREIEVAGAAADIEDLEFASMSAKEVADTLRLPQAVRTISARRLVIANSVCRSNSSITNGAATIMTPTIKRGVVD